MIIQGTNGNKTNSPLPRRVYSTVEPGFTLIELLVAATVLVLISGVGFKVFDDSIDVYHNSSTRIVMAQKCRVALDYLIKDLSNIYAVQQDDLLVLISQDNPGEVGDRDLISFVSLQHTDPDPFLAQLSQGVGADSNEQETPVSDVQRIAYYVGPELMQGENNLVDQRTVTSDEDEENLVLLRVATTSIDPTTVITSLFETGTIPTEDSDGNSIYVNIAQIVDRLASFDLKYSDGDDWYESWDDVNAVPNAVQVLITVLSEGGSRQRQDTGQNSMTQSTIIHLPMSPNPGGQGAGGQPVGASNG